MNNMKTYSRKKSCYLKKAFIASNFNEMCRLCLSEVDMVLTPIIQDTITSYPEWIQYGVDVSVEEGDGLPPNICEECLYLVEQTYLFKKKCKTSDSKLREYLELLELNEECKLNNIGFNSTLDDKSLFQKEQLNQSIYDEKSLIDIEETLTNCGTHSDSIQKNFSIVNSESVNELASNQREKDGNIDLDKSHAILPKVKRYILKGEKEDDGQEDLTVCEVIPLNFQSEEFVQSSKESPKASECSNFESFNHEILIGQNDTLVKGIQNEKLETRIQEIYELWNNEEEGEEEIMVPDEHIKETIKNSDKIGEKNLSEKKESININESNSQPNIAMQKPKVYTNKNHIEIVETIPQIPTFKCFFCQKPFSTYSQLKDHLVKTHETLSYVPCCEMCGKNFTCTNSLKRHMTVHTGIKPYKCEVCGRKFSQGSILKRHLLTHESLKPFNCHICQKSYTQKMNLVAHLKSHGFHTGGESFNCKICDKSFLHASGLSRHVKLHKGVRFLCVHCKKLFVDASALTRHIKVIHQIQM